jgi:hypothetical protein
MSPAKRVFPVVRLFLIQALISALLIVVAVADARTAGRGLAAAVSQFFGVTGKSSAAKPASLISPASRKQRSDQFAPSAVFTGGDLVVFRADTITANNTTFSIVEVNPNTAGQTGTAVQTIGINGTSGGGAMRSSGSASSTGYLATTNDGTLLTFAAHNSTTTSGNANTITARGVGSLNNAGTFALQTTYTGSSGDQARGATSLNNTTWYIADQGGLHTNGSASPSPNNNLRSIKSFGGSVYTLQQSSTGTIFVVSTVSAPSGGTITGLPGLTNNNTAQDFYLISSGNNGAAFDVLYVLNNTSATAGTIQKYSLVSGTWTANGTYTTSFGGFGIAAAGNGNGALLYVTSGNGATATNNLIKLTDIAGYNTAINITTGNNVTLFTSPATTGIKGIAFAPAASALADLSAGITGPANGTAGTPYDYTIKANNSGAANATGVKMTFTLPIGVSYNSASGTDGFSCSQAAGVVTCIGAVINANASATIIVSVSAAAAGPISVRTGAVTIDPDATIGESNEGNNSSSRAVSTVIGGAANTSPTIVAAATTTGFLNAPAAGPAFIGGVIGDPTDPAASLGIDFTVGDAETAVGSLVLTAVSSTPGVVPNNPANLVFSGSGATRTLKIVPAGVGYSTITVTVTDAGSATGTYIINYAASAVSPTPASTFWHTGTSDGSAAVPVDANYVFVGDDENQTLRLFSRNNSGLPVYGLDVTSSLGFTDLAHPEADIEGAAKVGNRIYWMASQDNASSGNLRPNRYRLFATDISGTGAASTLIYVGRYDGLRTDLLNWDSSNAHGLGANHYGLVASAASGVAPETPDGSGFNIEGFVMAPGSTTTGYVCFRAPISPAASRTKALIVPVTNLTSLVTGNPSAGPASFGTPIELDLGGRGIRDIAKNAGDQYVIVAGPASDTGPFALYTWTGLGADAPVLRSANLTGLHPEGIAEVPASLTASSMIELIGDDGDVVLYNDGTIAKDLTQPNFKKFRSDPVTLGTGDFVFNTSGSLAPDTYHDVTINNCGTTVNLTGNITITGTLTINNCGTLNTNGFTVSGAGGFILNDGGTLRITDPNGITSGATPSGSVQNTGGRTFGTGANYVYNGSTNQAAGNGLPGTVANLTIANTGGAGANTVTGNTGQVVTGTVRVTSGIYSSASTYHDVDILAAGTLSLAGPVSVSGTWSNAGTFTPNGFTVTFNPTSGIPTISGNNNFDGLTISSGGLGVSLTSSATVNGLLTLNNGFLFTSTNVLTVGTAGSLTRVNGVVSGNLRKNFSGPGSFTYAVGTLPFAYVPVNVTVTAGSGFLQVAGIVPENPSLPSGHSLNRFWRLTSGGGLTTNLVFNYGDSDVQGNESTYQIIRIVGGSPTTFLNNCAGGSPCVNTVANTATINGVSNFSDWTVGEPLAPTATNATIAGRVLTASGHPIANARVVLTSPEGDTTVVHTGAFGYYRFTGLDTGGLYVVAVGTNRFTFATPTRTVELNADALAEDFVAEP